MALPDSIAHDIQELFCADNYDEAHAYLLKVLEGSIDSQTRAEVNKLLGRIHYYRKDPATARDFFRAAIEENPDDSYALFYLAQCLSALGDTQSSLRIYAECLERAKSKDGIADYVAHLARSVPFGDAGIETLLRDHPPSKDECAPSMPRVSVIILCYNKLDYTIRCLTALFANTDYPNLEVIVVDNASIDDTPGYLEMFARRITFLHSPTNLGFVGGNNVAAGSATGDLIVFLNNDTEVQKGWLTEMLRCLAANPDAGAIGARLLYPDGKVQEAGGIIFSNGNGWNYGRGYPANSSLVSFVREVDYCSGAALLVRADLFKLLGGFDSRYAPAYYEDSDLCFGIRALGFKVLYCPSAVVIHHEGITSGTKVTQGFKRFQEINLPKFREKWSAELRKQFPNDPDRVMQASRRGRTQSVLIIDDQPPLPDKASGMLRMYKTLKEMVSLGWSVTYVHLVGTNLGPTAPRYFRELSNLGVEFVWLEYERWWEIRNSPEIKSILRQKVLELDLKNRAPDFIYVSFWFVGEYFLDLIRELLPETPIIVDTVDIHYVREIRQAELQEDKKLLKEARAKMRRELAVYAKADSIIAVTDDDREVLMADLPSKPVFVMSNIHEAAPSSVPFRERKDIVFIGNFNHLPNVDAVEHFVKSIFPLIKRRLPEMRLLVVGNNPPQSITSLQNDAIEVTGWVPSLSAYLDHARVSIAPLRYGAGVKGKVGEALAHGLPCVMTSIAAEGMNIEDGKHALIADDPDAFAAAVVRLYNDESLWKILVVNGLDLVERQYPASSTRKRLEYITSFTTRKAMASPRAQLFPNPPRVSIIMVTFNQLDYTRQCLESIKRHTKTSYEIVIVDNASTDGTAAELMKDDEVRLIRNTENVGYPAAVNQGLVASIGEHVLLLNNDAIVTEGWLERMLEVAMAESSNGIVGPMCNAISGAQFDHEAKYATIEAMHSYAAASCRKRKGEVQVVPRVAFFCTLIKRDVINALGGVDERFSPGNYEDDDYCLRANIAGFRTVIAKDVFVHHFGSKSFRADGDDSYKRRLDHNLRVFAAKWGASPDDLWTLKKAPVKRALKIALHDNAFLRWFERARMEIEESALDAAYNSIAKSIEHFHDIDGMGRMVRFDDLLALGGSIAVRTGHVEEGIAWYRRAAGLAPGSAKVRTGLTHALEKAGTEPVEPARTAAKPIPREPALRGSAHTPEGERRSTGLDSRLKTAQQLFADRRFEEALAALATVEEVLSAMEDGQQKTEVSGAIENFRGVCCLSLEDYDAARQHFENGLHINPSSSRACAGLGEVFFATGRLAASKTMFEWAVKNDADSGAAREGLARANVGLGFPPGHSSLFAETEAEAQGSGRTERQTRSS